MKKSENEENVNISLREYLETIILDKCDLWNLSIEKLRAEWLSEHKSLIQRFDSSEHEKEIAKLAVDEHFVRNNDLQNRMEKLTATYATKNDIIEITKEFERRLDEKMKNVWTVVVIVLGALVVAYITHVFGSYIT